MRPLSSPRQARSREFGLPEALRESTLPATPQGTCTAFQ